MPDYFGFEGDRARLAHLYHRAIGATQKEIDDYAKTHLNIDWKGKYNILNQADEWGHKVWEWDDPNRGHVFKLEYNRSHRGRKGGNEPPNWEDMNQPAPPAGITPTRWHRTPRRRIA